MVETLEKWIFNFLPHARLAMILSQVIVLFGTMAIGFLLKFLTKKFFIALLLKQ